MFELGDHFAGYRLDSVLGRGGMGVVYEAMQFSLSRAVALKVIAPGVSDDSAFRERFRREGPLQARLDHPHIVSVFEAGEWEGHLFLAMRLVRGPSLRELIREGPIDPERALRILTPVADALDAAHEESLIHRDIKPHNILIGRGDHAFLADFGLTKSTDEHSLTKTGHFVGTLNYLSPEQVRGQEASRSSDIYALAAVLYETLTGSPPFARLSDAATLYAHVADPPPRPSALRADLGSDIDDVIARGLAKQASQRPPTALALMDEAERALSGTARAPSIAGGNAVLHPPLTAPKKNAPTDELPNPDLAPAPVTDTDEEPVVESGELPPAAFAPPVADTIEPPALAAPTVAEPPTPPTRPQRGTRRWPQAAALALAAAAVGAGGFLVTDRGGEEKAAPAARRTVTASAMSVSVPPTWPRRAPVPEIEGLELKDPVAYGPRQRDAAVLLIGVAPDGVGPTLLPAAFRERLPAKPATDDRVVLGGGLQAQRYAALRPRGAESALTILVVPTDAGVLTLVCREGGAGPRFVAACQRAAGTARLRGARAFTLGADAEYRTLLARSLRRLQERRLAALAGLRSARTPDGQARRASDVAAAYRIALQSLSRTALNPIVREHNAAIRTALRAQAGHYADLSRAAARGRRGTYRRIVAVIARGDRRIRTAVSALRDLGFKR